MIIQTLQRVLLAGVMVVGIWFTLFSPTDPVSQTTTLVSAALEQYPPPAERPPLEATKQPEPPTAVPQPTAVPNPQPTSTSPGDAVVPPPLAQPSSSGRQSSRPYVPPLPEARITGTVIDKTTGIPMRNLSVRVGDTIVQTDAFGNYERNNLAAGHYCVELLLDEEQGMRLQYPMLVTVVGDTTVTRHLFFYSDPPVDMAPILSDCSELEVPVQRWMPPAKKVSEPMPTP